MTDRRDFIKTTAAAGAAAMLGGRLGAANAFYQTPSLIPLFANPLRGVGPGGIPVAAPDAFTGRNGAVHYTINVRQYQDNIVPTLGPTTLWGYDPANPLGGGVQAQRHLGAILIGKRGQPIQITFNNLLDSACAVNRGRHIIPNDTTIMGADLGNFRLATHFHGGFVPWISDGGPHTWFDPYGNYGESAGAGGAIYKVVNPGLRPGQGEVYYPLDQSARFGWYHDHALGITRINAYAGVASGLIIRDDAEADLVKNAGLPPYIETSVLGGTTVLELPLVFQDKIFVGPDIHAADPTWRHVVAPIAQRPGSLWYAHVYDPAIWDQGPTSLTLPDPSVIPEFFGDTMLVNGTAYPSANVEPRRYRLRLLNACNARFLNLQLYVADSSSPNGIRLDGYGNPTNAPFVSRLYGSRDAAMPQVLQIGTEGGFLAKPTLVRTNVPFDATTMAGSLIVAPAERPDLIIDFSAMAGKTIILYNDAPAPFPMGDPANDHFQYSQYGPNTRVLMRFVVGRTVSGPVDPPLLIKTTTSMPGVDPAIRVDNRAGAVGVLTPTPPYSPKTSTRYAVRRLTLNEDFDAYGRLIQMLGTTREPVAGAGFGRAYMDPATETVAHGETEVWEIFNTTADVHPMHWHLVNVQAMNRQPFSSFGPDGVTYSGPAVAPAANELGWKETVPMYPGTVTRAVMTFNLPTTPFSVPPSPRTGGNEYVWHCHILEHEEHDMMRPLIVR